MYKIALISDNLTASALEADASLFHITPFNYWLMLKIVKPDILLIESAWQGYKNTWKYKIASYPDYQKRNNDKLVKVINYAKQLGIPTVFWNKEDSVHFHRFIDSAKHCDKIYTVDVNAVKLYQDVLGDTIPIDILPFPVQPKLHYPFKSKNIIKRCSFVGSFSTHIHTIRRERQMMLFEAAQESGLDIFNRNSDRKNSVYSYPVLSDNMNIFPSIIPQETVKIYNDYIVNLNINTIEDSRTMYSRRLIEIIACESMAITTPAQSVEYNFKDFCYSISSKDEAKQHIDRICMDGLSKSELDMLRSGREYVCTTFSYKKFLETIMENIYNPHHLSHTKVVL